MLLVPRLLLEFQIIEVLPIMDIQSETDRIQSFVDIGNYHAAINLALSGMNECRRNSDQAGIDHFLGVIKAITNTLIQEFGSKAYRE